MYILSNKQIGKSLKGMHPNSRVAKKLQMSEVHWRRPKISNVCPGGRNQSPHGLAWQRLSTLMLLQLQSTGVTISFCLDLYNFAMTPRLWYLSIWFNLFYLVLPCGKTMWWLWSRLRTNRSVPSGNTNIIKRKICKRHMIRNHKSPLEERERSGVPVQWVWIKMF